MPKNNNLNIKADTAGIFLLIAGFVLFITVSDLFFIGNLDKEHRKELVTALEVNDNSYKDCYRKGAQTLYNKTERDTFKALCDIVKQGKDSFVFTDDESKQQFSASFQKDNTDYRFDISLNNDGFDEKFLPKLLIQESGKPTRKVTIIKKYANIVDIIIGLREQKIESEQKQDKPDLTATELLK